MKSLFGESIDVGFTGTQIGMTKAQGEVFYDIVGAFLKGDGKFHHGNCVGADAEAHRIVRKISPHTKIVCHDSTLTHKSGHCKGDEHRFAKPPLERNAIIASEIGVLIATPKEYQEVRRSGTWSTVRYARQAQVRIVIIYPDGSTSREGFST